MEKNTTSRLTLKQKIGYGCCDAGGLFTFSLMSAFFTRYCLNILGVSTEMLATLLLVWNVWDAVNDPMMGTLMDKVFAKNHDKRGKFRPWILRATPMLAVSAIALWTLPTLFDGVAMLAVLFVCKILYEGAYTMLNIPMGSMLSAMSDTDEERAQLSSARGFGSLAGGYTCSLAFPLILGIFGDTAKGYGIGATIMAICGGVVCFFQRASQQRVCRGCRQQHQSHRHFCGVPKEPRILGALRSLSVFLLHAGHYRQCGYLHVRRCPWLSDYDVYGFFDFYSLQHFDSGRSSQAG